MTVTNTNMPATPTRRGGNPFARPMGFIAIVLAASLAGCSGGSLEDLRAYTEQVLKRKAKDPDPPPEIKPYVAYSYKGNGKDPFKAFYSEEPPDVAVEDGGDDANKPDINRLKEELESYPLDSLRMVGTLDQVEDSWGIIVDRNGTIYRVKVGHYMGQNYGKIIAILEDRIELTEKEKDSKGRWQLRDAALSLVE